MSRIRYTSSAEFDLLDLWLTIAEENPAAADSVLDSIQATVSLLSSQPEMGRARAELGWAPRFANLQDIVRTAWNWFSARERA